MREAFLVHEREYENSHFASCEWHKNQIQDEDN